MTGIRQYLISITAAAVFCGIVTSFLDKKSVPAALVKLLAGLFLSFTVISPWVKLQFYDITDYAVDITSDAAIAVEAGEIAAQEALVSRIKSETEAYILDKAASWGAELTVEVTIADSDPPIPSAVRLTGAVSPYVKAMLSQMLETDIGIPKEAQIWTG